MTDCCNNEHQKNCGFGCGCGCKCGCGDNYHHHHHDGESCDCAEKFLHLADEAWVEVLKEKIKAKIISKKGEHLEKLADIIAKANCEKWKTKIASKHNCNEFKEDLKAYFRPNE